MPLDSVARQVGRTISNETFSLARSGLVRPEADPRNWFLSSQRKQYNPHGKTRAEQEKFKSTPHIPVQQDNCRIFLEVFVREALLGRVLLKFFGNCRKITKINEN